MKKNGAPHERLFWRSGGPKGNHAVRQGSWKYVQIGQNAPELYDLSRDVSETNNLAGSKPEIVTQIQAAIAEWEKGTIQPIFEGLKAAKPKKKKQP